MAPVKPSGLSPLVPVPWSGVRAWLDAAEATQAATGGSTAHLAPAQLLALSQLASFCGADEPDVSKQDHVSKLMRMSAANQDPAGSTDADAGADLSQARRLGAPPTFEMSEPIEVPFRGAFQLRWHCACVLPWCGRRFPASGGDAEEPGRKPPPLFTSKKDAKQYAAMLAVAYLDSVTKEVTTSHSTPHTPTHPPPPSVRQEKQFPSEQNPPQQTEQQQQQQTWPTQPTLTEPVAVQAQSSPAQHAPRHVASHLPPFEPVLIPSPSPPHSQPSPSSSSSSSPPPSTSQDTIITTIVETPAPSSPPRLKRHLDSPTTPAPTRRASPLKTARAQRRRDATPPPAPPAAPFVSPKGRGAEAAAEQRRLFNAIAQVSRHLGVSQPQYRLTQDPEHPNFFSGHAEFSVGSRVPEGIAVASGVLGKRQTRIHIAEQVLAWMEKEALRRQKLWEDMS